MYILHITLGWLHGRDSCRWVDVGRQRKYGMSVRSNIVVSGRVMEECCCCVWLLVLVRPGLSLSWTVLAATSPPHSSQLTADSLKVV